MAIAMRRELVYTATVVRGSTACELLLLGIFPATAIAMASKAEVANLLPLFESGDPFHCPWLSRIPSFRS